MLNNYPDRMDTTKYDNEMARLRQVELDKAASSKPVGRPKGPEKVMFRKRIEPSMVTKVEEFIKGGANGLPKPVATPKLSIPSYENNKETEELKGQIKAVLEDVGKLTKERDELLVKRENWIRSSESQQVRFWINKYDQLKASLVKGEYDQSV